MKTEFIARIETVNSGGGTKVDLIHLKNGRVISISAECVMVLEDEDVFFGSGKSVTVELSDFTVRKERSE